MHRLKDLTEAEYVFQLLHPALPCEFAPLRSLTTALHNLPLQLSSFVGRVRELAEVIALFADKRQITLTGAGGAGKTRMALQVATETVGTYPGGAWLVELAPLTDPVLVPQTIASIMDIRDQAGRSLNDALNDSLRSKQLLLVLDNCEHLVLACAQITEKLLGACPNLKILATSREPLGIVGETIWRVPSLSVPVSEPGPKLGRIAGAEAVQLFVDRAAAAVPGFVLSSTNAEAVSDLCRRLDGIPLAIELAAARLRAMSVEQIRDRLDGSLDLLVSGNRTAPPRQQTLRTTLSGAMECSTRPRGTRPGASCMPIRPHPGAVDRETAKSGCA
jgi:predicted ATPase